MTKRNLEIIGWILLIGGFGGCIVWASIATDFTKGQYGMTLLVGTIMGILATIFLRASYKRST